jgi:hypothetical protein
MRRLSIAALALLVPLSACIPQGQVSTSFVPIPRPSPEDNAPAGIAYICEGNKEVSVVYAKNRATVTFGNRTWRTEYQVDPQGFRYADASVQWIGRDDLASLRETATANRPLASNCRPYKRTT